MKCKNCGEIFNGNFCNNCGQSARVKNISLRYLIDEVPDSIFQVNHGLLFTIKDLFTRPGYAIRDYITGKRKNYSKPLAFIILASALYVLTNYLLGGVTFMDELVEGINLGRKDSAQGSEVEIFSWIKNNQTYTILFLLPFYSFASFLAYRKMKCNYTEHLILNIYITGQQLIIYTIFSFFIDNDKHDALVWIPLCTGMFFNALTFNQFFENKMLLMKIVRILLFYIFLIVQIITIIFIAAIIWKTFR